MEKKVALITNIVGYSRKSVVGDYSWQLANKLSEKGYKVYYYCKENYLKDELRNGDIELNVFPERFWKNVRKSLKDEGVKVCVFQYMPSIWGVVGLPFLIIIN